MRIISVAFCCGTIACAPGAPTPEPQAPARPETRFEQTYSLAMQGDPAAQNLTGYMLFYGEGVPPNRPLAGWWFRAAAHQGLTVAQANLSMINEVGAGLPRDPDQARHFLELARANPMATPDLRHLLAVGSPAELVQRACTPPSSDGSRGEEAFGTFCAGCHGLNGLAHHPDAPSFALGERMEKPDQDLMDSILRGHGSMPAWSSILPQTWLEETLGFVHSLEREFREGTLHWVREPRGLAFNFGAMSGQYGGPYAGSSLEDSLDPTFEVQFCPRPEASSEGSQGPPTSPPQET